MLYLLIVIILVVIIFLVAFINIDRFDRYFIISRSKRNISLVTKLLDSFLSYRSISETFDSKPRFRSRKQLRGRRCRTAATIPCIVHLCALCTSILFPGLCIPARFHLTLARIHFPHPLAYFTRPFGSFTVCTLPSLFTSSVSLPSTHLPFSFYIFLFFFFVRSIHLLRDVIMTE